MNLIGIDLGGTKTIIAKSDSNGKITDSVKFPTPSGRDDCLNKIISVVNKITPEPEAIGCACGGPLDHKAGIVSPVHMPQWRNMPLKEIIESEFGCPFRVEVDTNAAALGEHRFGSASKFRNFIYITLSTGMGAGKLIDGKIYRGLGHPEMGHHGIKYSLEHAQPGFDINSHICNCGAKGCLESFVSGTAVKKIYGMDASEIEDKNVLDEIASNFGEGLRNIIAMHSPDGIYVGGGVAYGLGESLLTKAVETARKNLKIVPMPIVRLASLGYNSALMGSVALAMEGSGDKK